MGPISATSSPNEPTDAPVDPMATASSGPLPGTTASSRVGGVLAGQDLSRWEPSSIEEAEAAIESVANYCRDYCPVRLQCVEEACWLYQVEGRSLDALGLRHDAATEAVGVIGQTVTGLGI
jgi:hypothetical protein